MKKNGRPEISEEKKALLFGAVANGATVLEAARIAHINRNTATRHLKKFDGVPADLGDGDYLSYLEESIRNLYDRRTQFQKEIDRAKNTIKTLAPVVEAITTHLSVLEKIKDRAKI